LLLLLLALHGGPLKAMRELLHAGESFGMFPDLIAAAAAAAACTAGRPPQGGA
jgi:hypothetical protein